MAATEPLYLRLSPGLKDRIVAAARRDGVSANEWAQETLRRALASGAGGSVSAGLAVSSAPVASDVAEQTVTPEDGGSRLDRSGATPASDELEPFPLVPKLYADEAHTRYPPPKPGETAKALAKQVPGVSTAGDLAKKQVTPHLKQGQAGRKK